MPFVFGLCTHQRNYTTLLLHGVCRTLRPPNLSYGNWDLCRYAFGAYRRIHRAFLCLHSCIQKGDDSMIQFAPTSLVGPSSISPLESHHSSVCAVWRDALVESKVRHVFGPIGAVRHSVRSSPRQCVRIVAAEASLIWPLSIHKGDYCGIIDTA